MTRLESIWSREVVSPVKIERYELEAAVNTVEVIFEKDWILMLLRDGTMRLHRREDLITPMVLIPAPTRPGHVYFSSSADMRRSISSRGKNWVFALAHYMTPE